MGMKYVVRLHKNMIMSFAVILSAFCLLYAGDASAASKVVAKVGDTEITEADFNEALNRYIPPGGIHSNINRTEKTEYRRDALNELVDFELLSLEARVRGIVVSKEKIDEVVERNIKKIGSEEAFNQEMKKQGVTLEQFREKIRKHGMVAMLSEILLNESKYMEAELKEYYEKNRAHYMQPEAMQLFHILVSVEPTAPEEEWQKKKEFAEQLHQRIISGEAFGNIAYQYSDDPYKFKSGDLGMIHKGMLTPQELEDAAFGLKEGELSGVVRTIYGFHILKAGRKNPPQEMSFEEFKEKNEQRLFMKRYEQKKADLLERLRKAYPVQVFPEFGDK